MNFLLLGRGKTGSQVAEVAAERKHHLQVASSRDNLNGAAINPEKLQGIDVVLDFTAPHCVLQNIEACVKAGLRTKHSELVFVAISPPGRDW